jgi:multiple sugar transport system substrate-binding protein
MQEFLLHKKLVIVIVIVIVFLTTGATCQNLPAGTSTGKPKPIVLEYWKVYEESFNLSELQAAYQKIHPYISINYKNFTSEEYENELLKAFAEDRAPDLFSVHTTWMKKYQNLIAPLPPQVNIAWQVDKGTIKKETFTEVRPQYTLNLRDLRTLFPDVVSDNQVINGQIYGLPLSIDTLALFYNRDLLNNTGIASPPQTWDQFREQVVKLTKLDYKGNVIQSGAALGTAYNVERSTDILSLLMMQVGTPMTNAAGLATFDQVPQGYSRGTLPAVEALTFYTSFASPGKQVYTWNEIMPNSLQAFMSGRTAFFLGYAYQIPLIRAQAPKLNFEIVTIPQAGDQQINFANYWAETVSKKSQHQDEAWDFLVFATTNADSNKKFLKASRRPVALRSLINEQLNDPDLLELTPFDNQLLTAKSWYKGKDAKTAENLLKTMISDNLEGALTPEQIISLGVSKVNQTNY